MLGQGSFCFSLFFISFYFMCTFVHVRMLGSLDLVLKTVVNCDVGAGN